MIEIKSVRVISDNNGIQRAVFRLRSVPVFSDVVVFLNSIVVLTPNGNFSVVPLSHSVSDMKELVRAGTAVDHTTCYVCPPSAPR
jgi:hypothetical protein